jgi:hypothetical protein
LNADPACHTTPIHWALCLEYRECHTEEVKLPPSCDQKERGRGYNRILDDYRLSVRLWADACPEDHSKGGCAVDGLGRSVSIQEALMRGSKECPRCKKCDCVFLTSGTLFTQPGQEPEIKLDPDAWKYRRTVYTNPALGGLLQCFHGELAHIRDISWKPGHHFSVEEFLDRLKDALIVTFDRAMKRNTVENTRSCRLSVFLPQNGANCPMQILIPVTKVAYIDAAHKSEYWFDHECIRHEIRDRCKRSDRSIDVELVVHGSMILDEHHRALDAELIHGFPTGNGVEGGEFISYFTVGQ